jgi:predicted aspartyl protease
MGHVLVEAELTAKRTLKVRMMVDTGATHTVLPSDLARRLGIAPTPWRLKVGWRTGRSARCAAA